MKNAIVSTMLVSSCFFKRDCHTYQQSTPYAKRNIQSELFYEMCNIAYGVCAVSLEGDELFLKLLVSEAVIAIKK